MESNSKERDLVVFILKEIYGKLVTSVVKEPRKKKKKRQGVTATQNNPDEEEHADGKKILDDSEDEFVDYSVVPPKLQVQDKVNLLSCQTREVKSNINDLKQGEQTLTLKLDVIQVTIEAITIEANHLWGRFGAVSRDVAEVVRMVNVIRVKMEAVKENLKVVGADGELVQEKIEAVEEEIAEIRIVTEKMEEVKEIAQVRNVTEKMKEVEEGMGEVGNAVVSNETNDLSVCPTIELPDVHEKDSRFGREVDEPESDERLDDHDGRLVDQQKEKWKSDITYSIELGDMRERRKSDKEKWKSKRKSVDTKARELGEKKQERTTVGTISGELGEMTETRKTDEGKEIWQRERTADYTKTGKLGEMKEKTKRNRQTELGEINDVAEVTEDSDNFDIFDYLTGMDCSSDDGDTNDSLGFMGDVRTRTSESPKNKTGVTKNIDKVGECDEVGIIDKFLDDCDKVNESGDALCEEGMEEWNRESKGEMEVQTYKYGAFEKFLESEELSDNCNDEIVDNYFEEKETVGVSEGLDEIRDEIVKIYIEIGEITKDIEEFKTGVKSSERTDIQKVIRKQKPLPATKGCVCDQCGKVLATKKSLRVHKKRHTRPPKIQVRPKKPKVEHQCPVCGKLCFQKHNLRTHMKTHSHIPVECERCGQVCSTQGRYIHHLTTHGLLPEGCELNQCDVCGKLLSTPIILARHRRLHFRPRILKFECSYCSRRFHSQTHLDAHVAMHTGKRDFICEVCGKAYGGKAALRAHQVSHLPEKRFNCEICHKRFSRHGNYKRHLNIHSGINKVQCSLCGKAFRDSGNLKTHMKTHGLSRHESATCDMCHKKYASKASLEVHQLLIHQKQPTRRERVNVIMPVNCDICNKTLPSLHNLKQHMRTHIKNIICQMCGKAFSTNQRLNLHMVYHTREKNYPCDDCGRMFSQLNNLQRHKRVMHSDSDARTFECHVCGKSFKCIEYLRAHIKTHNKSK